MMHFGDLCFFGLTLLVVSNVWFLIRIVWPLRRLVAQTGDLTRGNFAALDQPCGGIPEIDALRRSLAGMAGHVRRAEQQRQAYTETLADGQEQERGRLAHELHDDTMQSLIAIAQSIDLATAFSQTDAARANAMLAQVRGQAVAAVDNLRRLIADLRPPALEELGLIPALQMVAGRIDDLTVTVETDSTPRRLDDAVELALFRSAQEALSNIRRHSAARRVIIALAYRPDCVEVSIHDDGKGFAPPQRIEDFASEQHFGLIGMRERIQQLRGTVEVHSAPGQGTDIRIDVPLTAPIQPSGTVRDPVCSALILPQQAYSSLEYEGQRYYFCCPVCEGSFQRDPSLYLPAQR
jgi:signal transduction histidine kinase/YHS domain-containing protein